MTYLLHSHGGFGEKLRETLVKLTFMQRYFLIFKELGESDP